MTTLGWGASWRIARRDLHAGFRGLRLLFVCLFLGVMTLAAIGSLTSAITGEISARGQMILGGDVEIAMTQRVMDARDRQAIARLGRMSETVRLRAMVHKGGERAAAPLLTELKGVDDAYPLYGRLALQHGRYAPLAADRILISRVLAERMAIGVGDALRYGTADFTVAAVIADEPDRVGEGFTLGPVAIVSMDGLDRTGLIQPGSLYRAKYRLRLPAGADAQALRERLEKRYVEQGWEFKDRERAAPGTNRFIENMGQFLSLIGLAALVIAGIGVSNGVASYLAIKRGALATFKVLGATSADIQRIYLLQIGVVAGLAILAGLVAGSLSPPLLVWAAGDMLPVAPGFHLYPLPLVTSAAYGLLIALIFTLPPLARARTEPVAAILRTLVDGRRRIDRHTLALVGGAIALLVAVVLLTARTPMFAAAMLGAIMATLLLLLVMGQGIRWLARRMPHARRPLLRLALANLHRPGAQTAALTVALGLALTLFVTLAAIQTSIQAEIGRTVPKQAPNLFILDMPAGAEAQFRAVMAKRVPAAKLNVVPILRGTVTGYSGKRVADLKEKPEGAWILRGERGVTYSATLPEGSEIVEGRWWPRDYVGPPLVSLDADQAKALDIWVGDRITVSILGREIEARVASLRKINWDTMGFNYVMVFSPSTLASAPHSLTATISLPDKRQEQVVTSALLATFPGASVIEVGQVISQVSGLLDQMSGAILAAASVTVLAGVAVLIGAIAAGRQSRSYDSVVLKLLGATRGQILGAQALEYGVLAGLLALVALLLGGAAAWYVVVQLFSFGWAPDWGVVLATLAGGAVLTLGIGLAGSIPLMSVRPAQALRQL